jgi:hypothetical protein
MARFNTFQSVRKMQGFCNSIAWGKHAGALAFAAILIVCSVAVGCSSESPKAVNSNNQIPVSPNSNPIVATTNSPAPVAEAPKPVPKKIVHKRPATLSYEDKNSGISFVYPRRYMLKTGDDAGKLVSSIPLPMDFTQAGGVTVAAVELPGTVYNGNDLAAAFFNVNLNKSLSEEQCGSFAIPQPSSTDSERPAIQAASEPSKLTLGDMEMFGTEAVSGDGPRQSDVKYFHIFENGACYEFALNVTTLAPESELALKHVDREKAFQQMEKILATVKINPIALQEVTEAAPSTPAVQETPAQ